MTGILDRIVEQKKKEVANLKKQINLKQLAKNNLLKRQPLSLESALSNGSGVIAEFKRASPSKGTIRANAEVGGITLGYQKAGASAISVLTDEKFFKAKKNDLPQARKSVSLPILRKEFIIDEYQIFQAKALGADAILLIAAILDRDKMNALLNQAHELGLEAIIEVHNEQELEKLSGYERIIGVNNRNLDTFEVNIETSLSLSSQLGSIIKVTESGLSKDEDIVSLAKAGYEGFLVGESFMKSDSPTEACREFVQLINTSAR